MKHSNSKSVKDGSAPKSDKSPQKQFDKKKHFDKKKQGRSTKESEGKGAKRKQASSTSGTNQKMDLIASLKTDWNKVRVKAMGANERNALMKKMADRVKGRILQVRSM